METSAREALATVDATPYFAKYGVMLAAAGVEVVTTTASTTLQSIRLDVGPSSLLHP
jgi:hypothetical protein